MPPYSESPAAQPQIKGSEQQLAIWDAFLNGKTHLVVKAYAGTGKTTTGVEGLRPVVAQGITAQFLAFNRSIANHLQTKVPQGAKAQTFHGAGFGACRNEFGQLEVDADRTYKMLPQNMDRHSKSTIIRLVSICKNVLVDGTNKQEMLDLCAQYDIDLYESKQGQYDGWQGEGHADEILEAVPKILEASKTPTGTIDFDDMVWLPVIWNLPIRKFDFLVVDESQDLNRAQQELALMIGKRIIMVGDEHQAIYAFRGADSKSMQNMEERLAATPRGVITLPLTVSYRCPRLVTAVAREIVKDFECLPMAPMGKVCYGEYYLEIDPDSPALNGPDSHHGYKYKRKPYPMETDDDLNQHPGYCPDTAPQRGDMVLCRTNAPLVQLAYQMIRRNIPCKIQGRDFGKNLVDRVKTLVKENASTVELLQALVVWESKERAKIEAAGEGHPGRLATQLGNLQEKVDCIEALCEGLDNALQVVQRIQLLFQDVDKEKSDPSNYVLLSSVHRAKGLEAHTVRIIKPELMPHPMASTPDAKEQEMNLKYVAITRSLDTLHIHDCE